MRLLPHQTSFVETCFNPASRRVIELLAVAGLGKTAALVALSGRLLQERPTARVLLLAPAALRSQFVMMLNDANIPCLLVDRYQYREMLDATAEEDLWPRGTVAVVSLDFAKLPDIRESLAAVRWDLVIVDEAHLLRGARAGAVKQISDQAERVVVATILDFELAEVFPGEDVTRVVWRHDQIVDHDGMRLAVASRPLLHEVAFSLSPAELNLFETVGTLCHILEAGDVKQSWIANSLRRSFQSSPAALESTLQRIAEGLQAQSDLDDPLVDSEGDLPEDRSNLRSESNTEANVTEIASRALKQMEEIGGDSKLRAFGDLLVQFNDAAMPSRRICVLTSYLGTLYYLAAEIEDQGRTYQLLHGRMPVEERQAALTQFSNAGAILTATIAMLQGIELPEVTDLVLYDMPVSKVELQVVLGRFDRFGRQSPLNVHVLVPSNVSDGFVSQSLGLLYELLGASSSVKPPQ